MHSLISSDFNLPRSISTILPRLDSSKTWNLKYFDLEMIYFHQPPTAAVSAVCSYPLWIVPFSVVNCFSTDAKPWIHLRKMRHLPRRCTRLLQRTSKWLERSNSVNSVKRNVSGLHELMKISRDDVRNELRRIEKKAKKEEDAATSQANATDLSNPDNLIVASSRGAFVDTTTQTFVELATNASTQNLVEQAANAANQLTEATANDVVELLNGTTAMMLLNCRMEPLPMMLLNCRPQTKPLPIMLLSCRLQPRPMKMMFLFETEVEDLQVQLSRRRKPPKDKWRLQPMNSLLNMPRRRSYRKKKEAELIMACATSFRHQDTARIYSTINCVVQFIANQFQFVLLVPFDPNESDDHGNKQFVQWEFKEIQSTIGENRAGLLSSQARVPMFKGSIPSSQMVFSASIEFKSNGIKCRDHLNQCQLWTIAIEQMPLFLGRVPPRSNVDKIQIEQLQPLAINAIKSHTSPL